MKNSDFESESFSFDLGASRKGVLNENILHVFAAWVEYLLSKMFPSHDRQAHIF